MSKEIAFLEYVFMFDPSETWSNIYDFEDQLSQFFNDKGLEAVIVNTVKGQSGGRILMINKKPNIEITDPNKNPKGRPPSIGTMFRKIEPEKKVRAAERNFKNRAK